MTTPRVILSPIRIGVNPIREGSSPGRYQGRRGRTMEAVGRWKVGRTAAMRWDGIGRYSIIARESASAAGEDSRVERAVRRHRAPPSRAAGRS